jgi:hypothetical protein
LGENRSLLRHFAEELGSRPGHTHLETPWTEYTNEQLNQWITARARVDDFWCSANAFQPRLRTLGRLSFNDEILLPGGRWMLGKQESESKFQIYSFDLESPVPKLELVISVDKEAAPTYRFWPHWVDPSQPRLTLRVAIVTTLNRTLVVSRPSSVSQHSSDKCLGSALPVHVYNVEIEGHGRDAKLVSQHLITFRRVCPSFSMQAGLDGEHYIDIAKNWRSPSPMIVTKYCKNGQPISNDLLRSRQILTSPGEVVSLSYTLTGLVMSDNALVRCPYPLGNPYYRFWCK